MLNTTAAIEANKKITVAIIVKINKAAGTCGLSIKPSETGGSITYNRHVC